MTNQTPKSRDLEITTQDRPALGLYETRYTASKEMSWAAYGMPSVWIQREGLKAVEVDPGNPLYEDMVALMLHCENLQRQLDKLKVSSADS